MSEENKTLFSVDGYFAYGARSGNAVPRRQPLPRKQLLPWAPIATKERCRTIFPAMQHSLVNPDDSDLRESGPSGSEEVKNSMWTLERRGPRLSR